MNCTLILLRSLSLALLAAVALLALQVPLEKLSFYVLSTEPEVAALAREYFISGSGLLQRPSVSILCWAGSSACKMPKHRC